MYNLINQLVSILPSSNLKVNTFKSNNFCKILCDKSMLKQLQNVSQRFDISKALQFVCKKSFPGSKPQIDFILLEKQIGQLKMVQSNTIQSIVQFVDIHLDDFVGINDQMSNISDSVQKTEIILQLLNSKLQDHRNSFYRIQAKLQLAIDKYEQGLLQNKLLSLCMQQSQFLIKFNKKIELIMQKNVQDLTFIEKHLITRFCYKYDQMVAIFSNKMIQQIGPDYLDIKDILLSLQGQLQLYLCEQLKKFISNNNDSQDQRLVSTQIPKEFQIWFSYLNKKIYFYETIQQYLISKQLTPSEKQLITNKVTILSGKNQQIVDAFFENLFKFIDNLPKGYPHQRILQVVSKFLDKKQIGFIYTYMMPVYPIAYSAYMKNLEKMSHPIKDQLRRSHNFNIKRWADIRAKNIMDRSEKDSDLIKWIDIIFKSNCMLEGVKTNMVRLCLQVVQKHCQKSKAQEVTNQNINKAAEYICKVPQIVKNHINNSFKEGYQLANKIAKTIQKRLVQTFSERIQEKLCSIVKACANGLQNHKTLIMRVLSKKNQDQVINKSEIILKPLNGYIKNNPDLSSNAITLIKRVAGLQMRAYYETNYQQSIINYCRTNVTSEQLQNIKGYLSKQKQRLAFIQ